MVTVTMAAAAGGAHGGYNNVNINNIHNNVINREAGPAARRSGRE